MKKCPICDQTYTDESLNFCLNDGGTLLKLSDDAPPTVFMNQPRVTSPMNWTNSSPPPVPSAWQNSPVPVNSQFMSSSAPFGQNQTLPMVSLVLGVFSIILFCCFGGIPLGIGAVVTGYLGMSNADKSPQTYGGRGLAIAGIVVGAISLVGSILWLLAAALGKH